MDTEEIKEVCEDRLVRWKARLCQEHATPMFLLGVGHDQKSGQIILCTVEEMPLDVIKEFLKEALRML